MTALAACAAYLAGQRHLVVLDNCEHLAVASRDLTGSLLGACADRVILATSRVPLGLAAEHVSARSRS